MNAPDDLLFTKDHEWVRREGDTATVGITDYAQSELGDIVFVELPEVGSPVQAGHEFGTVESVKAVSEIFAPVSGAVIEVNASLRETPEVVNTDPYQKGWILKVKSSKPDEFKALLTAKAYAQFVEEGGDH